MTFLARLWLMAVVNTSPCRNSRDPVKPHVCSQAAITPYQQPLFAQVYHRILKLASTIAGLEACDQTARGSSRRPSSSDSDYDRSSS
jgi:predicted ATPase with chaperone activity